MKIEKAILAFFIFQAIMSFLVPTGIVALFVLAIIWLYRHL